MYFKVLILVFCSIFFCIKGKESLLYLSDHSYANLYAYSTTGSLINNQLLSSGPTASGLRGLLQLDNNTILIANSDKHDSKILKTSLCGGTYSDFITESLSHPYAISIYEDILYITNQNSDKVTSYTKEGKYLKDVVSVKSPRGISFDIFGNMYVASSAEDQIYKYDPKTGKQLGYLNINHPIGILTHPNGKDIFVGSVGTPGSVILYQVVNNTFKSSLAVINNSLYVVGQQKERNSDLFLFNIETQEKSHISTLLPVRSECLLPVTFETRLNCSAFDKHKGLITHLSIVLMVAGVLLLLLVSFGIIWRKKQNKKAIENYKKIALEDKAVLIN